MVCPGFIRTNISLNAVVGDGTQQGTMDAKTGAGMTAEQCAERMVKAVERNKAEVLIGRYEILAAYIKRLSPASASPHRASRGRHVTVSAEFAALHVKERRVRFFRKRRNRNVAQHSRSKPCLPSEGVPSRRAEPCRAWRPPGRTSRRHRRRRRCTPA